MITPDPEPMARLGKTPPFRRITLGLLWARLGKTPPFGRITFGLLVARLGKTPPFPRITFGLLSDYFGIVQKKGP